ncbi:MAG: FtsX-like permease family protein, partial [Eubacteriales bacterium]
KTLENALLDFSKNNPALDELLGISTDPEGAKERLENIIPIFDTLSSLAKSQIDDLKSIVNAVKAYLDTYENAPDSPEKQEALAELRNMLESNGIDSDDINKAKEDIENKISLIEAGNAAMDEMRGYVDGAIIDLDRYLEGKALLEDGKIKLEQARIQIEEAQNKLDEGKAEFEKGSQAMQKAKDELQEGKEKLLQSEKELSDGKAELIDAKAQLEEGKSKLEQSKAELEKGISDIEKAKSELANAKDTLAKLEGHDSWTIQNRRNNVGYQIADMTSGIGKKLCYSLSILFVFVGVMVCYTSLSRIVREDRVQTGVQKALGFRRREIIGHYMSYAILSVVLGGIFGALLGYFVIEKIMNISLGQIYVFNDFVSKFSLPDLLIITAVELILICASAWIACHKQLSRQAIDLLRGTSESSAHRIRFYEKQRWWSKCSLYTKTIINNLFSDKTRIIATLVGVIGCTSLIVMALTVRSSIINTPKKHFANVNLYDRRIVVDEEIPDSLDSVLNILDENGVQYTTSRQKAFIIEDENGKFHKANVIVPQETENLDDFLRFNDARTGKNMELPEDGIFVSYTYKKYHDISAGDELTIMDSEGKYYTCTVAGITEHYLTSNQIVMSPSYYESLTGTRAVCNTVYLNLNGANAASLEEELSKIDGFLFMENDETKWIANFASYQGSVTLMVTIAFFLSVVM